MTFSLLTHSRMSSAKLCLRRHWYEYEQGLRLASGTAPLRIGQAVHLGLDVLACGTLDEACEVVSKSYEQVPGNIKSDEWATERNTCLALLVGYHHYWPVLDGEILSSEREFCLPLRNPESGRTSRTWMAAGKVDKIISVDGRVLLREHKTCGEDISPDSDYWKRLLIDQQISHYVIGARGVGYDVQGIQYDVIRKPEISRRQIPLLDDDGLKVVLDVNGDRVFLKNGKPRQSGDKDLGFMLQARLETPDEFMNRLIDDIAGRPEFYYARREIPRLEHDITEYAYELWQIGKLLTDCRRFGRWFRNTAACLHPYRCAFFDICTAGIDVTEYVPDGFVRLDWVHPELESEEVLRYGDCTTEETAGSDDDAGTDDTDPDTRDGVAETGFIEITAPDHPERG